MASNTVTLVSKDGETTVDVPVHNKLEITRLRSIGYTEKSGRTAKKES